MKSKYQDALNSLNPNYIGEQEYSWRKATELLQELVDKETPKKVKRGNGMILCSNCNKSLYFCYGDDYCTHCGQKLDWSENNVY